MNKVNLASAQFKANPYPFYATLRAETPVYKTTVNLPFNQPAWLITRYDDVALVLRDERFVKDRFNPKATPQGTKRPWIPKMLEPLTHNMLDQDGLDHTRLRTLVQKGFTPRLIEG